MGKPIRLGKAAGELNVGIQTLVDFLQSKGIKIDTNPNTKLEGDHFDLLCQEFAADQNLKEQAKVSTRREKRETLSLEDIQVVEQPEEAEEEEETEINVEEIKRQILSSGDQKPTSDSKIQVVGKIDLSTLNQKNHPDKKKEEPVSEQPVLEQVSDQPKEEKEPEIETIRFERQVLSGPTVLGKIELPVEKPKTPVATSSDDANSKRKRKRIKKVEVNPTANQQAGNKFNKGPKVEKQEVSERDIQKEIKETLARLSNQGSKSKASKNRRSKRDLVAQRRQEELEQAELEDKILKLTEFVTVSELASMMNVAPTQVISV
ncbi:MAG: translation initiation factor IF-2, partial [Crocinitomicaceae bacterium]